MKVIENKFWITLIVRSILYNRIIFEILSNNILKYINKLHKISFKH